VHSLPWPVRSSSSMSNLLQFLQYFLLYITYGSAYEVTWYIGNGANSSSDISVCGRTPQLPCVSLSVVLVNSDLFEINNTMCYSSTTSDNRTSTTIVFLGGSHLVPTICLFNWTNVHATGDDNVTIYSESLGDEGLFSFANSSNITITNLNFEVNFKGRTALLFDYSSNVTVVNCSFSSAEVGSRGIHARYLFGDWLIQGCNFKGNVLEEIQEGSIGLYIWFGEAFSAIRIRDCAFSDFFISQSTNEENWKLSKNIGQGLQLRFYDNMFGHYAEVSGCHFIGNFAYSGSTFLITFEASTMLNTVVIDKCTFLTNHNLYGGGLAIYYWGYSSDNSVSVNNSVFRDNTADLEGGGLFAAFVSEHVSNILTIENCVFENNSANEGAGLQLFNFPGWFTSSIEIRDQLVNVTVRNNSFMNNTACGFSYLDRSYALEGVINALRIRLSLSETKYCVCSVFVCVCVLACVCVCVCAYSHTLARTWMYQYRISMCKTCKSSCKILVQ